MPSRSREANPTGPYSLGAPNVPSITIPIAGMRRNAVYQPLNLRSEVSQSEVSEEEFKIMQSRCQAQMATDRSDTWQYQERYNAQAVLDFMYLGPFSVLKDIEFLKEHDITMVVLVRDARLMASKAQIAERAATEIGLELCYAYINGMQGLIHELPQIFGAINSHLVRFYREHEGAGQCRGKVLVTCESGNGRSAAVVAAYIMLMFGCDLVHAIQYIMVQRFCVNFDDDIKHMLRTWQGILQAKRAVTRSRSQEPPRSDDKMNKRGRDEEDTEMLDDDNERFRGRESHAPFADVQRTQTMIGLPDDFASSHLIHDQTIHDVQ